MTHPHCQTCGSQDLRLVDESVDELRQWTVKCADCDSQDVIDPRTGRWMTGDAFRRYLKEAANLEEWV